MRVYLVDCELMRAVFYKVFQSISQYNNIPNQV